jgi:AcrR family transcriptional regulator
MIGRVTAVDQGAVWASRPGAQRGDVLRNGLRLTQRERIIDAVTWVAFEQGVERLTVAAVVKRAGLSRKTFYDLFADCQDCLAAAFEEAVEAAEQRARAAFEAQPGWQQGIRAGLGALLEFFSENPHQARLCVVDAPTAGPAALALRARILNQLAEVVDRGRERSRSQLPALTAQGVVGGVHSVLHERLLSAGAKPRPLTELLGPLTAFVVLPYMGAAAARREAERPAPRPPVAVSSPPRHPLRELRMRVTYRTLRVLDAVSREPGISNVEVSRRAGISDQGQASKLLARLARLELLENTGSGQAGGAANSWRLSEEGERLISRLHRTNATMP